MKIMKLPTIVCRKCACQFKINKKDIRKRGGMYNPIEWVECPLCGEEIRLPFDKEEVL